MIRTLRAHIRSRLLLSRTTLALSRASATQSLRTLDARHPETWEFSGFSQNGEDGILDFLSRKILRPTMYAAEIGASDGLENNTSWLAIARRFSSTMVEGDPKSYEKLHFLFHDCLSINVDCINLLVTLERVPALYDRLLFKNPDVFSIDIDGNDYYILKALFELGLRPAIVVVEYNAAFGPKESATIEYQPIIDLLRSQDVPLYYGVSVTGWRTFFKHHRYAFVGVDSNGVNAIFIDPKAFPASFPSRIRGTPFRENLEQMKKHNGPWTLQFEKLKGRQLVPIA